MGAPPNASAQVWEAGFMPEAQERGHHLDNQEQINSTSRWSRRSVILRRRQLLRWDEDLVKCWNSSATTVRIAWIHFCASLTACRGTKKTQCTISVDLWRKLLVRCCGIWGSHQKSGLPYPPDSYLRLSRHQCACAASAREV